MFQESGEDWVEARYWVLADVEALLLRASVRDE